MKNFTVTSNFGLVQCLQGSKAFNGVVPLYKAPENIEKTYGDDAEFAFNYWVGLGYILQLLSKFGKHTDKETGEIVPCDMKLTVDGIYINAVNQIPFMLRTRLVYFNGTKYQLTAPQEKLLTRLADAWGMNLGELQVERTVKVIEVPTDEEEVDDTPIATDEEFDDCPF